jgi:hypothetical protein
MSVLDGALGIVRAGGPANVAPVRWASVPNVAAWLPNGAVPARSGGVNACRRTAR